MKFDIKNISSVDPHNREKYFFDANVWIFALMRSANITLERKNQCYADFFEGVIALNNIGDSKALKLLKKQGGYQPIIVMTSLLMSEIINAFMKGISYRIYLDENDLTPEDTRFKQYRKTSHYKSALKKLKQDLSAFDEYIEKWDDTFSMINYSELIDGLDDNADFNDFYYYYLLRGKSVSIVTDDSDFSFPDIEIITNQPKLLHLK